MRRILTLDDLIDFCQSNKLTHYSAAENDGRPIVVNTIGNISCFQKEDDPTLTRVTLKACHCGLNRNNSKISEEVMKESFPSFANKPILAEIITDENGVQDFGSHSMTVKDDSDGNKYVYYIEKPIGLIPESNNIHLEYDKENDKTYTVVDGYIFNYYGNEAIDIIKRKNGTKVSIEIDIEDMSWNANDNTLSINKFIFTGVSCLGEDIEEGMKGSRLDLMDFSKRESMDYSAQLIEMQDRLSKLESVCFDINDTSRKEEQIVVENQENFEEVAELEEVTETEQTTEEEVTVSENESEETVDETSEVEETVIDEHAEDVTESVDDTDDTTVAYSYVVNGESKTFAISLQDKIYSLMTLVNEVYAEQDNTYYGVTVYAGYVIMEDYSTGRCFRQSYTDEDDVYTLVGDRVEVYVEYVTSDEQEELDSMRSNYAALVEYKDNIEKAELHSQKESLLSDSKYSVLADVDKFNELKENMDNYSLDELETEAKIIFADYVASVGEFSLNADEHKEKVVKLFNNPNKRNTYKKSYSHLFDN